MLNIKKIRPMFTKILTTMDRYEEDQTEGMLVNVNKLAGAVKEYQRVLAVGSNPAGIKEGDVVMINPARYAVMKHKEGSLKDGVITDNPVVGYNLPVLEVDGKECMLLETNDISFVIEEFEDVPEEKTPEQRAAEAGIYAPGQSKIRC